MQQTGYLDRYSPYALAALRFATAPIFMLHGTQAARHPEALRFCVGSGERPAASLQGGDALLLVPKALLFAFNVTPGVNARLALD